MHFPFLHTIFMVDLISRSMSIYCCTVKTYFFCIVTIIQVMLPKRYLKVHRGASSFFPVGSISTKTMQPRRCGCVGPKKNQTSPEMLMYKPSVSDPNLKKKKERSFSNTLLLALILDVCVSYTTGMQLSWSKFG